MQPQLKLVDAATVARPDSALPVDSIEPRVLTGTFVEKLALVTGAERELRSIGVRVIGVSWDEPALRVEHDPQVSMKPLIDRVPKLNFRICDDDSYDVWARFSGVIVYWRQALCVRSVITVPTSIKED